MSPGILRARLQSQLYPQIPICITILCSPYWIFNYHGKIITEVSSLSLNKNHLLNIFQKYSGCLALKGAHSTLFQAYFPLNHSYKSSLEQLDVFVLFFFYLENVFYSLKVKEYRGPQQVPEHIMKHFRVKRQTEESCHQKVSAHRTVTKWKHPAGITKFENRNFIYN